MVNRLGLIGTLVTASLLSPFSYSLAEEKPIPTTSAPKSVKELEKDRKDIKLPEFFCRIVESHVKYIMDNGNAKKISYADFDHGHLITKDTSASSIEELLDDTVCILYHTRESGRDECGGFPKEKERSLVGLMNGKVVDAKVFVNSDILDGEIYKKYGTIYGDDLAEALNATDKHDDYWTVLNIIRSKDGDFEYKGIRYDVFTDLDPSVPRDNSKEAIWKRLELGPYK